MYENAGAVSPLDLKLDQFVLRKDSSGISNLYFFLQNVRNMKELNTLPDMWWVESMHQQKNFLTW